MPYAKGILYGPEGEEFSSYALNTLNRSRWPWGTQLVMQDGRKFRFGLAGASNLVAGDLQQAAANTANHVLQTPSAAGVAGDRSLAVTMGATAVTINEYQDGFCTINLGTGFGYTLPVDAHAAVASAGVFTIPFGAGYTLQAAVPATANSVSAIHNPYWKTIAAPTTLTQVPVGVAPRAITASHAGWLQTFGPATVTTQGTVVIGNIVVPSGTTAGSVSPMALTEGTPNTGAGQIPVGRVMLVATTTNKSVIYLTIDA